MSSFVCFHLVVAPAMRHMQGHAQALLQPVQVKLGADMTPDPQRPEYHRAMLQWETYVQVPEAQLNQSLL